jgi:hypothetical protein
LIRLSSSSVWSTRTSSSGTSGTKLLCVSASRFSRLAVGGPPPAQGSRPLNFAAAPLNPARAAKLVAAEAPTEGCEEYPAQIPEYLYPEPQSWVQRRACRPGQASVASAATSHRRQVPAPVPVPEASAACTESLLTHASIRLPCPTLHVVVPRPSDPLYLRSTSSASQSVLLHISISASFIVHAPCGRLAASRLACNCLALRIIASASPDSYSGCWRINRTLNFQQPSVSAVCSCRFSAEPALAPLVRHSL